MRLLSCLLVAAAFGLVSAAPASAQTAKIASVNAGKVFAEIKQTAELRVKLEEESKNLQSIAREKEEKLRALQKERDELKPDSPQFADKNRALVNAAVDLRVWREVNKMDLERSQKVQMREVFNAIQKTVGEVAAEKGVDLVIAEQGGEVPDSLEQITLDQLRAVINSRNVLYVAPTADLTAEVVARMDAAFASGK